MLRPRKRNSVRTRPAPSAPAAERRPGRPPRTRGWRPRRTPSRPVTTAGCSASARCAGTTLGELARPGARYSASSSGAGSTCSSPVPPSTTTVVPSGIASTSRPAATTTRDVAGPGQDRGVRGRAAVGEDDSGHQLQVQAGGLGGRQVAGHQDARAPSRAARRSARAAPAPPPRGRPRLAPAGRGRAARPLALDVGEATCPGGNGPTPVPMRALTSASISASASSDRCASKMLGLSAPTSRTVRPGLLDLPADGGHGFHDATPLRGRLTGRPLRVVDWLGGQASREPDGIPGEARIPSCSAQVGAGDGRTPS